MLAGCLALLAGAVMTLAAIQTASAAAFLAGTAVAGAGVGTGFFLGAYRILTALASPGQRAGLVAAIWIVFYLAFSVPVVAAGVATTFGLHQTAVVYSAALAVLAAAAAGSFLFRRRSLPAGPAAAQAGPDGRHARTRQMTEMTTVQAVDHHTANLNGTWLYRAAAAPEPEVIYGSHVHPDLPGGTAQPSEGATP